MKNIITKQQIEVILISNDYGCFEIVEGDDIFKVTVGDRLFDLPSALTDYIMSFTVDDDDITLYLKKEYIA